LLRLKDEIAESRCEGSVFPNRLTGHSSYLRPIMHKDDGVTLEHCSTQFGSKVAG